jgi:hypothetical protein
MFFFRLFTLCSARLSALVIVLNDSACERIGKWGDFSDFVRGQIVNTRLVVASVIKTAIILDESKATDSKVMTAYTNHGKTTSGNRNSGRKSTLTQRGRRIFRRIV